MFGVARSDDRNNRFVGIASALDDTARTHETKGGPSQCRSDAIDDVA
jgi:hypothetical protein